MAPKDKFDGGSPLYHQDHEPQIEWVPEEVEVKADPVQTQIVWRNVFIFGFLHLASVYALFLVPSAQPLTWLFSKCIPPTCV